MKQTLDVLSWCQTIGFALVALATFVPWVRRPSRARGWLALAVGLLALVSVVGRIEQETGSYSKVFAELTIPAFLLSGYALLLYRHSVLPLPRLVLGGVFAVLVGVSATSFVVTLPTGVQPVLSAGQWALVLAMLGLWAACVVEPAIRFWLASTRLPSVQRARLRALSAGYGGIVLLLLIAVFVAVVVGPHLYANAAYQLTVAIVATASVPLLYVGFAPPRTVRQIWMRREESALRRAFGDLLLSSSLDRVAEQGLDWSIRLVGGDGGVLAGAGGEILAGRGVDPALAATLASLPPGNGAELRDMPGAGGPVVVCSMPLQQGVGVLAVVAGPFTPSLGGDELSAVSTLAVALASALERTRLADELARQTAFQESVLRTMSDLGEGCVVIENDRIVFANEAFCWLVGRSREELSALPSPVDVVVAEDRHDVARRIEHGVGDENLAFFIETALMAPDGRRVQVDMGGKAVQAEGQYILICRDVSERRRAREELERSNADLQEFAYVASHDLQEPLRMVASYLQLLDRRYRERLDADGQEFLAYGVDGAVRMQVLINDLLMYSRAGASVPMQPVNTEAVVATALSNLQASIAEAQGQVVVESLPVVLGDSPQLVQVFQNLVSNALKFRGERAPVVTISAASDGDTCTFAVSDNGIGIEERHRERIFMIFRRLHTQDRYAGTGIGLAICKRIVERHGGRIWVDAAPGGGSVFHVALHAATLPVSVAERRTAIPA